MNEQTVIDIGAQAIWASFQLAAPALLSTLAIGLVVSVLQAATQINEQTLAFIPKVIGMTAAMIFCGPWLLQVLMNFTSTLFKSIPGLVH